MSNCKPTEALSTTARVTKKRPQMRTERQKSVLSSLNTLLSVSRHVFPKGKKFTALTGYFAGHSRKHITKNLRRLRCNWRVHRAFLELLLGRIRKTVHSPHNRKILAKYISLTHEYCHIGPRRFAKKYSTLARDAAILGVGPYPLRTTRRSYLFVASTLARATHTERPSQAEIEEEVMECIGRITCRTPLPSASVLDELRTYVMDVLRGAVAGQIPNPAHTACYERSQADGGCYRAIDLEFGQPEIHDILNADPRFRGMSEYDRMIHAGWYLDTLLPSDPTSDAPVSEAYANAHRPDLITMFKRALDVLPARNKCRILPIVETTGKIRIATIHSAVTSWVARAINSLLLPYLKRFSVTRSALREQGKYYLVNHSPGEKVIYSADLSKSTDPMSIDLVQHIFQAVSDAIPNIPDWFAPAVKHVLGAQELEYRGTTYRTECGALMGVGPGWTALCLLNAFCAYRAGAPKGSFKVCGDDLSALWSAEVCDRYEQNLRMFGLVPNLSKSFRSPSAGVFCERLVGRDSPHRAIVLPIVRLGEASGFRSYGGEKGRLAHDALSKASVIKPLRWLVRSTLKSSALGPRVRGRYQHGGGGDLPPDKYTVLDYYMRGGTKLLHADSNCAAMEDLREVPPCDDGVPLSRVSNRIRKLESERRVRRLRQGTKVPDLYSHSALQKRYAIRRAAARTALKKYGSLRKTLKMLREAGRSIVRAGHPQEDIYESRIIRLCSKKRYGSALTQIRRWSEDVLVDKDLATELIRENYPEAGFPVTLHLQPTSGMWENDAIT